MSGLKTPNGAEIPRESFLQEEPPREVVDNITLFAILSGVTDPQEIEAKIREGLEIARETRRAINAVFAQNE